MEIANVGRMAAAWLFVATALACAPGGNDKAPATEDRQKIIVEFAVPEPPADAPGAPADPLKTMRKVAETILSRLDAPVRESAKLYEHLPLIALEVDAATVMRLLRMPEVVSIQPDLPVTIIGQPGDVKTYGVPSVTPAK